MVDGDLGAATSAGMGRRVTFGLDVAWRSLQLPWGWRDRLGDERTPRFTPLLPVQAPWEQRPAGQWTVAEVGAWLAARSGAGELAELAHRHSVSGRALLRLTEGTLRRMGVSPRSRRRELLRELLQLRLRQELEELLSIVGGEHPPRWGRGMRVGTRRGDAAGCVGWWSPGGPHHLSPPE